MPQRMPPTMLSLLLGICVLGPTQQRQPPWEQSLGSYNALRGRSTALHSLQKLMLLVSRPSPPHASLPLPAKQQLSSV